MGSGGYFYFIIFRGAFFFLINTCLLEHLADLGLAGRPSPASSLNQIKNLAFPSTDLQHFFLLAPTLRFAHRRRKGSPGHIINRQRRRPITERTHPLRVHAILGRHASLQKATPMMQSLDMIVDLIDFCQDAGLYSVAYGIG